MLTKETITSLLQDSYPYLAQEYGVNKIGLFGSYAHDRANEASDVDLVVEFSQPPGFKFMELIDYLEQLLDCRVDILTTAGLNAIRVGKTAKTIQETVIYV